MTIDPRSVAGKRLDVGESVELLVVGAGPAGCAAAIEAARLGLSVLLVDEHPVPFETMSESVPLQFGGRMGETVRNRNGMTEAMLAANPLLETAFEAGVDVRLGTACIGLYGNTENVNWLPGTLAALVDEERGSVLVAFGAAVVATGRRDMGLAFPGWERAGVLGATAAVALAERYRALDGQRAVVLGTTAEAMLDALALRASGVEIAALVEQGPAPVGPAGLLARIEAAGIPVVTGAVVAEALGSALAGVEAVRLSGGETLGCDLVVLAVGTVPVVDLLDAAGCRLGFDAARGGFVPETGAGGATSLSTVFAAGDCAGIWAEKSADAGLAEREGRAAARAAARALERAVPDEVEAPPPAPVPPAGGFDLDGYRRAWVRRSVVEASGEPHVCQCEEVTAREILEVRPPRYLGWSDPRNDPAALRDGLGEGPPHPDQIKRLTRAGMGPCQGRRCREQVQTLLALQADRPVGEVRLASHRAPVRPVTIAAAAPLAALEDPAIREEWDSWFGMPRQWVPFWDVEEHYTVAGLAGAKQHVSE